MTLEVDSGQKSSDEIPAPQAEAGISKARSRFMGTLVLAAILLPMIAAYTIFKTGMGIPGGTVNKGELLMPPQAIGQLEVKNAAGEKLDLLAGEKKWRLLIPGRAICDQACQESLYVTRQVHIRLGNKAARVERLYLNLDADLNESTAALLVEQHPKLKTVHLDSEAFVQFLSATNIKGDTVEAGRYFVMDQEGYVMMSYTPEHTGNELLDDLKRLLKYSYEG